MKTKNIDRLIFNTFKLLPFFIVIFCTILNFAYLRNNQLSTDFNAFEWLTSSVSTFNSLIENNSLFSSFLPNVKSVLNISSSDVLMNFVINDMAYLIMVSVIQVIYRLIDLPLHIINDCAFLNNFKKNKDE